MTEESDFEIKNCLESLFRIAGCQHLINSDMVDFFAGTRLHNFKKGEVILKQGVKTGYLVFLTDGIVKFNYEDDNGKNLILTINKAPTLLGLANILNEDINIFSIIAVEDCKGCLLDLDKLKFVGISDKSFMMGVLTMSTEMFRTSIYNFISLAHKQVNGRIADILIYLSQNIYHSGSFQLSLSRQEMAEFAGCSKENVIHTLRKFDADGIISVTGKNIEIIDIQRLVMISKAG